MTVPRIVFVLLTLAASISPLLTFAGLWQIKEWRVDRLRDHLQTEGLFRQLFGVVRPAIVAIVFGLELLNILPNQTWIPLALLLLAVSNLAQWFLRRQSTPVWTQKAIAVISLSILLNGVAIISLINAPVLPFLPLLQPFIVLLAWVMLWPLDHGLKTQVMQKAKKLRRLHDDLTVIGITGSVGKTTVKELLLHILRDKGAKATPTYVNTEMGVSKWLIETLQSSDQANTLIIEMGAYRKGEIELLCDICKPQMGIITFIGSQHIGLFGSQEALCEAKGELFAALPEDGKAFFNGDNEYCTEVCKLADCETVSVGTGGHADLEAFDIEETGSGIRFRLGETHFDVPLHGTHNVTNVLLTIAIAKELGMETHEIAQKLKTFTPLSQTFAVRHEGDITILDDTHNCSPASFRAAIAWARSQPMHPKILLTSGLIELGAMQERIHENLGLASRDVFDDVIFLHPKRAKAFARGYGKQPTLLQSDTPPLPDGGLLVCEGRMPQKTIASVLP